jgi:hypothetical protein
MNRRIGEVAKSRQEAQSFLNQQRQQYTDQVNVFEVTADHNLSQEDLFNWFMATQRLEAIEKAKGPGWAAIEYIPLKDIPEADELIYAVASAEILKEIEPERKIKRQFKREANLGSLALISLGKQTTVGRHTVDILGYDINPHTYYSPNGNVKYNKLVEFVDAWDEFQSDHGPSPELA